MKKLLAALRAIIEGLNEDIHNRRMIALFLLFALAASLTACSHNRRGGHHHGHKHHYNYSEVVR